MRTIWLAGLVMTGLSGWMGTAVLAADKPAPAGVPARSATTEFAFEAHVTIATPLVVGNAAQGLRRVVPITGGVVRGPGLSGKVLPGGADWQYVRADGALVVDARYTLQADDGTLIMITNKGIRRGPREVIERLTRGEDVDPKDYYFRTVAEFEAPLDSRHAWLNQSLFVGVAERHPDAVTVRFYELK